MRIALGQLNPTVGDFAGNLALLRGALTQTASARPELLVLPELFLAGYPPRDLLERSWFIARAEQALTGVAALSRDWSETGILVGLPTRNPAPVGHGLFNSAALVYRGAVVALRHKSFLPTYDVFDESRYFDPAPEVAVVPFRGEQLGITICEDAWNDPALWPRRYYPFNPLDRLARQGATIFVNIAASPFHVGKELIRYRIFEHHAREHGRPCVFVNQVGANDELVFDGRSLCVDGAGRATAVLPAFESVLRVIDTAATGTPDRYVPEPEIPTVHDALVLGIRDYLRKCGFTDVLLGLSGGIDSAVTAALACAAIGADHVLGVLMPGPYSSPGSITDARELVRRLGMACLTIPIEAIVDAVQAALRDQLAGRAPDTTEENIQARARGNVLMALSNRSGRLLLSTGNKSELAVGYCTLYGDMSGGLAVISDVPKTMVYELARHINRAAELIPAAVIAKVPSAELKPDQKDEDTLPPYPVLDRVLELYLEEGRAAEEIVGTGLDRVLVEWVIRAVNRNEYKRRQAAPGIRISAKAFGMGRRMPIAARYD